MCFLIIGIAFPYTIQYKNFRTNQVDNYILELPDGEDPGIFLMQ